MRLALVIASILLILGHVCELPLATGIVGHAEASEADEHGDVIHGGSCEAATTDSAIPFSTLPAAGIALEDAPGHTLARPPIVVVAPTVSPPLFLLHAALLI